MDPDPVPLHTGLPPREPGPQPDPLPPGPDPAPDIPINDPPPMEDPDLPQPGQITPPIYGGA